jgi:hypothetical protein
MNPAALTVADAAKLLAATGDRLTTEEVVRMAIDRGALRWRVVA